MKTSAEIRAIKKLHIEQMGVDGGAGRLMLGNTKVSVIWSNGGGWDHVSICPYRKGYTPTWEEMCLLKDLFFRDDEVVIQYHPAKSQYVNNMEHCLHLWKPQYELVPTPPSIMVGIRDGQSIESAVQEARAIT